MSPEQRTFFTLATLPARLTALETAWFLNMQLSHVTVLVAVGLLKPLGHPAANAPKFFATCELESLRVDRKWLAKATDALISYNRNRNKNYVAGHCADETPPAEAV